GPWSKSMAVWKVKERDQGLEAFSVGIGEEARHSGDRLHLVTPVDEEPCQVLREQPLVRENEHPAGHDFRGSKGSARRTRRFPALVLGTPWGISRSAAPHDPTGFVSRPAAPAAPPRSRATRRRRRGAYTA